MVAAPYQGATATDIPTPAEDKNERDALDKPSLVRLYNSATAAQVKPHEETNEIDFGLALPPGTRLRGHLESALSSAVKTPVVAVIEIQLRKERRNADSGGSQGRGQFESADRSGYIGVHFDTLLLPNGTGMSIDGAATDLQLRLLRGRVHGKNTARISLVRSLAGIGEAMATLVDQGSLNQPLNQADLLRAGG